MKKGFTLIELLVVVLIIGVLAAVALPQYKRAVEKSKYAEAEAILQSIYQAQQRNSLIKNGYVEDFGALDIDLPDISGKKGSGNLLVTKYFEISLKDVNEAGTYVKAMRKVGPEVYLYGMYKNLNNGQIFCEDLNTNDAITCEILGLNAEAYTCDDKKTISTTGPSGCPPPPDNCPSNCECPDGPNGPRLCWDYDQY